MTHITFVVSRDHLDLVPELTRENRVANVEIIVDRRQRERRLTSEPTNFTDCRHSQRRIQANARELDLIGVAVAVIP